MWRRPSKGNSPASIKNLARVYKLKLYSVSIVILVIGGNSLTLTDIAAVGHFSIDSILLPSSQKPYILLGGSVAYVALSAQRLGVNVSVISKVGGDFPEAYLWWLGQEGINLSKVSKIEDACTTRFELRYSQDLSNRSLRLTSKAPPISVDDVPNSLKVRAIHIAPIANEIKNEVVEKLKAHADFLSLDPQGFLRNFDQDGNVVHHTLPNKRIFELVNIYKSSSEEIMYATNLNDVDAAVKAIHDFGVKIVIVTLGMKGALLSVEGTNYKIPAYNTGKAVDPTGAGDVFIGAFLAEYLKGKEALWCACVGSAAASIAVEAIGPTFADCGTEIYRRAHVLCEKEIKNELH
jgi:sugar/nucleoside kinase (ribokinase family)